MTELPGREEVAQAPRAGWAPSTPAIAAAFAGLVVVLLAAATGAIARNVAIIAGAGASVVAIAALAESAPAKPRTRPVLAALIGAQGLAAAILLSSLVPGVPPALPLATLAVAAALTGAGLAHAVFAPAADRPPRAASFAARIAAIALVLPVVLQRLAAAAGTQDPPLRAAGLVAQLALGVVLLASMSTVALRLPRRWVIAGLLAWTVGWVASMADVGALLSWSLGASFPVGQHQLQVDADLVQIVGTLGGLAIGAALVAAIRESRFRHSALVLLVGYAVFSLIAAVGEHRIDVAADFPRIVALRKDRDLADAITALALAGVLWLYWRRTAAHRRGL